MNDFKNLLNNIIGFLFPRYCVFCGQPGKNICNYCGNYKLSYRGMQSCPKCYGSLPQGKYIHKICKMHSALDGVFVVLNYEANIKRVLSELKFHFYTDFATELGQLIQQKLNTIKIEIDYLVPVPLSKSRFNWRGFNQSKALAENLNIPLRDLLIRTIDTKSQARLNRMNRLNNLNQAFSVFSAYNCAQKNLMLVDDVTTTSATLEACAQALKKQGAKTVYGLVLAKDNRDFSQFRLQ
jgi:ComF family protein